MKRKICVITGTRADYGILQPVIQAIKNSRQLKLQLVVTGMHLMKEFGYTVKEIIKDGCEIEARVNISYQEDSGLAMADSLGRAVSRLAKVFSRLKPDVVVVLGDRGEMLAAAVAANYLNIAVAHIHGGEVSGHVDGLVRHAITKLAHIHFPATEMAKTRILRLGEEPWRITKTGAPALDNILSRKKNKDKNQFILVVQHPVNTESDQAAEQMRITLQALEKLNLPVVLIYPNADAGGRKMIRVIKQYEKEAWINTFISVPHTTYLDLMATAAVMVGNSSSGLIEAPSFGLPFVNIGNRQKNREQGNNVINVGHNMRAIIKAIKSARIKKVKNPYGDGKASQRIAKKLAVIKLGRKLIEKQMTY